MTSFSRRRYTSSAARGRKSGFRLQVETLEARTLLSLSPIDFGAAITSTSTPVAMNGALYFTANDGTHGNEVWKSDGTPGGTVMVDAINPGSLGSNPSSLTVVGSTLFFAANDGVHGPELWKSDGTSAGTVMVKDIYPGSIGSYPQNLTNVGGTLFFQAFDPSGGYELFRSDGTSAGTYMVKDINPGYTGSFPSNLTAVGSTLFFSANDGTHGTELWKSDGTSAGTVMVADINPGGAGSYPSDLTNVGGTLFFAANDGVDGFELWKSDGTSAGTVMLKDIDPGPTGSLPSYLTNVNGTLFFAANDGTHGYELWKSDGTSAGTVMVADIDSGSVGSTPNYLTAVGSTLFFSANDGTNGTQLWKSDGTTGGTVMVADINPGGSSSPTNLLNVDGMLYFAATTSTYGNELWQSDGTSGGTTQVADIYAGALSSNPTNFVVGGSTLFFTATDALHPARLWKDAFAVGSSLPNVSVGSTLPNSTYGQSVNFTVSVSGSGPTPTGTVQFRVDGTDFGSAVTLAGGSATSPSTTLLGAGNHTVEAYYAGDSNYSATSGTYTQVVNQAPLSIIPDKYSRAVGQANPTLTYTFTGFDNGENPTTAGITGSGSLTTTATISSPAGDYPIRVTGSGTLAAANYNFPSADFGTGTLTVTPFAASVVVVSTLPNSTYGQAVSFTVTVSGGGPTPTGTVQFLADGTDYGSAVTLAGGSATGPSTKLLGAGNHTIKADYSGDSNYSATSGIFIQGVSKAHLTVTADTKSMLYGDSVPALTATISGFVNGDTSSVVSGTPGLSTSAASASPVGAYPIIVTASTLSAANYDFPNLVNSTLTVNKAHLTVTADPKSKVYGAALPTLTATLSGFVNGETSSVVSGTPTLTTAATAASHVTGGSYPILVSAGSLWTANYSFVFVNGTLSVTPAPLTITANSATKAYAARLPALSASYSGFVNGDSPTSLTALPTLSTTVTASSHVRVGGYPITVSGASDQDYTITYVPGTLTITAVPLTIIANNAAKVYGAAWPAFSASYGGLVNGDTEANLTTPPTLSTTAISSSHVLPGGYAIMASGASDGDYTISYQTGTLFVTPAPLLVTANSLSKVYGAPVPALSSSYSGFVNGDGPASLGSPPSVTTTAAAASPALPGGYAIIAMGGSDPDYAISFQPGTLFITPAPLTITADNAGMTQGTAVPSLSVSYSGFVNGDSPASLATQPTLATSASPLSPAGTYPIVAGGASSRNYAINYASGVLIVTPAPVRVLSVSIQAVRLGKTKKTTQVIVLQFSGALNAGGAQRFGDYSLETIPSGKKQKSKPLAMSQATYNPANNTVRLASIKPRVLDPPLKLTINASWLLDILGRPLDGDHDGQPGGNFTATLSKKGVTYA